MSLLKWGPLPVSGDFALGGDKLSFQYKFVYSSPLETALVVLADLAIKYGHARGSIIANTRYYCSNINAAQQSDGKIWIVTASYEQFLTTATALSGPVSPLDEPWAISYGHTSKRQVVTKAYATWNKYLHTDGGYVENVAAPTRKKQAAVLNSYNDVFDPAYEKEVRLLTITLAKNRTLASFAAMDPLDYDGSMNHADIVVAGKHIAAHAGLLAVDAVRRTYIDRNGNPAFYMAETFNITIDPDLWAVRIVDQGFHYKKFAAPNKGTPQTVMVPGIRGQRESKPAKLDGEGHLLTDKYPTGAISAVLRCFFTEPPSVWGALDLPSSASAE